MSVNIDHYIVKGVKLDPKIYKEHFKDNDELEESLQFSKNPTDTLGILYDGMNGDYILAGKCLFFSDDYYGFPLVELDRGNPEEDGEINLWLKKNNLEYMTDNYSLVIYVVSHAH